MMDIHQTKRLWASLSPRLVRAASDRLTSEGIPTLEKQTDQNHARDRQRDHPVRQVSHSSSYQRDNS